jgi:hypothetical protein
MDWQSTEVVHKNGRAELDGAWYLSHLTKHGQATLGRRINYFVMAIVLVCRLMAADNTAQNRVALFGGVMKVSNHVFYFVGGLNGDGGRWVREDRTFMGNKIIGYDSARQILNLMDANGRNYIIPLNDPRIKTALNSSTEIFKPIPNIGPPVAETLLKRKPTIITDIYPPSGAIPVIDGLDWKFIESEENPMKYKPMDPNREDTQRWKIMSTAEKAEVVNIYMQHGWATTVETNTKGVFYRFKKIPIGLSTKQINN